MLNRPFWLARLADAWRERTVIWLAHACEVSRPTISTYLAVLEATFVMHVVRPYAVSGAAEIIAAPRVYGFDTGFCVSPSRLAPAPSRRLRSAMGARPRRASTKSAESFDPAGLKAFRNRYPQGDNVVVAHDVDRAFVKRFGGLSVRFVGLSAIAHDAAK